MVHWTGKKTVRGQKQMEPMIPIRALKKGSKQACIVNLVRSDYSSMGDSHDSAFINFSRLPSLLWFYSEVLHWMRFSKVSIRV